MNEQPPQNTEEPVDEPVAEDGETVQPITAEQFKANLEDLVGRAKHAGMRPIQMMASSYLRQGLSIVDGLLGALEGDDQKKKKKK